jgi:large subunit ribosomal protein L31
MRDSIHPTYYHDTQVTCACGNTWTTGSTKKSIRTDVCSACHPFFTGEQRIVDTAGQVERFMKRLEPTSTKAAPVDAERVARANAEEAARLARRRGDAR